MTPDATSAEEPGQPDREKRGGCRLIQVGRRKTLSLQRHWQCPPRAQTVPSRFTLLWIKGLGPAEASLGNSIY